MSSLHRGKCSGSAGKEEGYGIGINGRRESGPKEIGLGDNSRRRRMRKKNKEEQGEEGYL